MNLGIPGFTWNDLHDYDRLRDLSAEFDRFLDERGGNASDLIDKARHLGAFLVKLFDTDDSAVRERAARDSEVARFKKEFVQRRVAKVPDVGRASTRPDGLKPVLHDADPELSLARYVLDGNVLAWPFVVFLAVMLNGIDSMAQHRLDLHVNAAAVAVLLVAAIVWLAFPRREETHA